MSAEAAAFAPLPDFCYGRHKAELETLLARDMPGCVRLRPHVILGPHAQPTLRQILNLPFCLRLDDGAEQCAEALVRGLGD